VEMSQDRADVDLVPHRPEARDGRRCRNLYGRQQIRHQTSRRLRASRGRRLTTDERTPAQFVLRSADGDVGLGQQPAPLNNLRRFCGDRRSSASGFIRRLPGRPGCAVTEAPSDVTRHRWRGRERLRSRQRGMGYQPPSPRESRRLRGVRRKYGATGQTRKQSGEKLEPRWPLVPFRSSWALTKEVGAVCRDQGPGRDSSLSA
jgi:hypothetical protein